MNEKKKCSKCGVVKELSEYHKFKHSKDGVKGICKLCITITNKIPENRIKRNESNKIWRDNNKEKVKGYKLNEYEKNKELILLRNKEWRLKNSNKYKEISDIYREKNKETLKNKKKEYREKNRDKVSELTKKWIIENYEKYLENKRLYNKSEVGLEKKRNNYHKNKEKNNHILTWRRVLINTIKRLGTSKEGKTNEILGYSAFRIERTY